MLRAKVIKKEFTPNIKEKVRGFDKFVAQKMAEEVKSVIKEQKEAWPPLNPYYKKRKVKAGYDPRMLIATGQYLSSITVYRSNNVWVVGTKPFRQHMGSKLNKGKMVPMSKLALWLEYGTSKMPARPHFRPAFYRTRQRVKELFKEYTSGRAKN